MDNSYTPPIDFYRAETPERFPWLNLLLFVLTCFSTLLVGTVLMGYYNHSFGDEDELVKEIVRIVLNPAALLAGLPFSIAIMSILFAHEMGHYLVCRYYGIEASLPYFIPAPTAMGTLGAFIRIRSPIQHRPALLEMGIAGPIAGFVVAVPALFVGLILSHFSPATGNSIFGIPPLIFQFAAFLLGKQAPAGMELCQHPVAQAAWFGFFATALNLIPASQLDGGHVVYALFGRWHKLVTLGLMAALVPLGIYYWPGWFVWLVFLSVIAFRFSLGHPPTLDDSIPLESRDIWLGWIALALFALCFTPAPFAFS